MNNIKHFLGLILAIPCLMLLATARADTELHEYTRTWTYYVSETGNDQSPGAKQFPWRTLQHAADCAHAGDTIDVMPGKYAGFVMGWDTPQPGAVGNPIVFRAERGAIINSRENRSPDGIDLETGCSNIDIEGFTIDNSSGTIRRAGIRIAGCDHCKVIGNVCLNNGDWGIYCAHCTDLDIENNVAAHSQKQHGIYVANSADHVIVRSNRVFDNANCGLHFNGDLSNGGGSGLVTNLLVEYNVIYGNGIKGGSAINCDGVEQSIIRDNLLYDNHSSGISLFQGDGAMGSKGNRIIHNTILLAHNARYAINIKNGSTGNILLDNILYDANTSHGGIQISNDSLAGFVSDYNVVDNRFSLDEDRPIDLAQWQHTTGCDAHSRVATPAELFVDPEKSDFHLLPNSPAIGCGQPNPDPSVYPSVDLDGRPWDKSTDVGVYVSGPKGANSAQAPGPQ